MSIFKIQGRTRHLSDAQLSPQVLPLNVRIGTEASLKKIRGVITVEADVVCTAVTALISCVCAISFQTNVFLMQRQFCAYSRAMVKPHKVLRCLF